MKQSNVVFITILSLFITTSYASSALANNLAITNTELKDQKNSETIQVEFDISWDNSWYNDRNHDAVWVFVKYSTDSGTTWNHATLNTAGVNPSDTSRGTGTGIDIVVPNDLYGAFIKRSSKASGTTTVYDMQLAWDYAADGVATSATARVRVFGVEMVQVPEGPHYVGDTAAASSLKQGSADTDPWYIQNSQAITVTNTTSNGFYYVTDSAADDDATGAAFTIPAIFPNGYDAIYMMKYEVTEGQYVSFLNTLARAQQDMRVATDVSSGTSSVTNIYVLSNTSSVADRNTVQCPASIDATAPITFSTDREDRACNYLSWMDLAAFGDWAALRPMTELEYSKAARGKDVAHVAGEFAWGSTTIVQAVTISGTEDGTEVITTADANAAYGNATFVGGDASTGPLRVGIFATTFTNRLSAGAGYYGNMELSGNTRERAVTIGNSTGRSFQATHGDGVLTTLTTYEGNATNTDWPGIDATAARGVTGAAGSGLKGGAWVSGFQRLQIADRANTGQTIATRNNQYGGRLVRTEPAF
jgi:formylglycine-generating enzyme required for sulfatase activity